MKTITFFKNNQLSMEHKVTIKQVIEDFLKTEESKWDSPFERLILNFMSVKYGSFGKLTDQEWDDLHSEWVKQRQLNKDN